ncbi:unnamed protein product [Cylicostephanus goldi]|uniref:Uncharacterized protein n=1 Tax=Cylicostephanus goldi TaxID=71465 RepID=A0A3P6SU22_CYLGO|nr:unnamed protein product [Cylicostephanus goldi]
MAGSLRWRGHRRERRSVSFRDPPLEPPSCLAFKYGAPDGVRTPESGETVHTRGSAFIGDTSYGATYRFPSSFEIEKMKNS